jgi:hypothetical protein
MVADTQPKTFTEKQYSELQSKLDQVIRDLRSELRETRTALTKAEGDAEDLRGQNSTIDGLIKALELDPAAEARLKTIIKGEGELSRRTTEYNSTKTKFEKDAKPIKEKARRQFADDLAARSNGQFTPDELYAQGSEDQQKDYWFDHYDHTKGKAPETPPPAPAGVTPALGGDGGLPPLPGPGGTPAAAQKTQEEELKELFPSMYPK